MAAAEVSASSGPIRVTFRLLRDRIHLGEPLDVAVRMTNIGRERILITDEALLGVPKQLKDRGQLKEPPFGVSVEVTDGRGNRVSEQPPLLGDGLPTISPKPSTPEEGADLAEADKKIKRWRAEGVSERQITLNLFQLSQDKAKARAVHPQPVWLKPGESIALPTWRPPQEERVPAPTAFAFTELPYYVFPRPGRYRVLLRVLYGPTPWLRHEFPKLGSDPEDVDIVTAPIEFEVLP